MDRMLNYGTQIKALLFPNDTRIIVGTNGVKDIRVVCVEGHIAYVRWAKVLYDDPLRLPTLWNLAQVQGIELRDPDGDKDTDELPF